MEPAGVDCSLMKAERRGHCRPTPLVHLALLLRACDVARLMLFNPDMLRPLNFADVAVRPEGDHWVVVDHADRPLLDQRFSDRFSAISLGLLVAHQQGGAVWLDELGDVTERPAHLQIVH
jgi:hypothetical protein